MAWQHSQSIHFRFLFQKNVSKNRMVRGTRIVTLCKLVSLGCSQTIDRSDPTNSTVSNDSAQKKTVVRTEPLCIFKIPKASTVSPQAARWQIVLRFFELVFLVVQVRQDSRYVRFQQLLASSSRDTDRHHNLAHLCRQLFPTTSWLFQWFSWL